MDKEIVAAKPLINGNSSYDEGSIKVLEGLEHVRKRPAMYIGDVSARGLHHLVYEALDNAIDEALAGRCDSIEVVIHKENAISVSDNGSGIPVGPHPTKKISTLEVVMTMLNAGGKFDNDAYKVSGGLHGVGISVVNALSDHMITTVKRDGSIYRQEYRQGKRQGEVEQIGTVAKKSETGTTQWFHPDPSIFRNTEYRWDTLAERVRELAFLNPQITVVMRDEREDPIEEVFHYSDGLVGFVRYIDETRTGIIKPIMVEGERETTQVEVCLQYNSSYSENVFSYVNDINTREGGTHVAGFRSALTRTLNAWAAKNKLLKNDKITLTGDDFREGLTAVISVKVSAPQFEGQTKTKLGNSEVEGIVRSIFNDGLTQFLEENPKVGKAIIDKVFSAAEAREAARKSRDLVRRKNALESSTLPGKLADCSIEDPDHCEIYLVEGDSAGGCFSGETKVALLDGRHLSFIEMVAEQHAGREHFIYTIRHDGTVGVERAINARRTKVNAEVIRVVLDNGEAITCTPDHKFMLRDGSYKAAAELTTEDSLMPLYRRVSDMREPGITIDGYEMVWNPRSDSWLFTHKVADWYNIQPAPEFRAQRRKALEGTYYRKTLAALKSIESRTGTVDVEAFNQYRLSSRDHSVLKFETFCARYFDGNVSRATEAVMNYNHRIVSIDRVTETMDVFDIEVPGTHNFALASGVFVHNSAKSARDRRTQAILPLRGKVLNVQKARLNKVLENEEIRAIFTALGVGFGETLDITKSRYGKVILMADADVDGSHIRTLLLTLFFNYMREMIDAGKIYLAMPPLYKLKKGKAEYYAFDDAERDEIIQKIRKDTANRAANQNSEVIEIDDDNDIPEDGGGRTKDGIIMSRFKGLGEMNPEQLWATTMNPETRTLQQVTIENAQSAAHIFETLMGDSVEPRRQFIERNARYVKNLDV